jgi:hypothetical protein
MSRGGGSFDPLSEEIEITMPINMLSRRGGGFK